MRALLLFLILIFPSLCLGYDKTWNVYIHEDGWAALTKSSPGDYSLRGAIKSIPKGVWLKHIRIFPSEKDRKMQAELHKYLTAQYPRIQAEALSSAGNMHNPKVIALLDGFKDAILATSMVKRLNLALSEEARCERVSSTSFEKFHIQTKVTGQPIYRAMIWLTSEKCT